MTYTISVSTFRKSCPDALHFYGVIRDECGDVVHEIGRQTSRWQVIQAAGRWAEKRKGELRIKYPTQHL